jgi:hypothetical protein
VNAVTQWFGEFEFPVRQGVYQTTAMPRCFQYWNGDYWGSSESSTVRAVKYRRFYSQFQFPRWRGLADKP